MADGFKEMFRTAWRDWEVDGSPVSGEHEPKKSEIRPIGIALDVALDAVSAAVAGGGITTYPSLAAINADEAPDEGALGIVYAGADRGIYVKTAPSGDPGWLLTTLSLPAFVLADVQELADDAAASATAAAQSEADAADDAAAALQARDDALAAAAGAGLYRFFDTKADAVTALGTIPADAVIEVLVDETMAGARTIYRKEGGVLVWKVTLDQEAGVIVLSKQPSLAAAVASANALGLALKVDVNRAMAGNLTLNGDVIVAGGVIDASGRTLTVGGDVWGSVRKWLTVDSTSSVIFSKRLESMLVWFTDGSSDGTSNDEWAIKNWMLSSAIRYAHPGHYGTNGQTIPFPTGIHGQRQLGAGLNLTFFHNSAGGHIFNVANAFTAHGELGAFTGVGGGSGVGSGYAVHYDTGPAQGFGWHVHDIYAASMGGGCVQDESYPGVFNTTWSRLHAYGCGGDNFDMGATICSVMDNCYAHSAVGDSAGFRIRGSMTLRNCNGLDLAQGDNKIWGHFGNKILSAPCGQGTTVGGAGGVTLPADAYDAYSIVRLEGCNIEEYTMVGIFIKQGAVVFNGTYFLAGNSASVNAVNGTADAPATVIPYQLLDGYPTGAGSIEKIEALEGTFGAAFVSGCPIHVNYLGAAPSLGPIGVGPARTNLAVNIFNQQDSIVYQASGQSKGLVGYEPVGGAGLVADLFGSIKAGWTWRPRLAGLVNAANDAAAAAGGVALWETYRNGSILMVRTV